MRDQQRIIDCHVHLRDLETIPSLEAIRRHTATDAMSIVCEFDRDQVNDNPPALVAKASSPSSYYVFAGLDHSTHFSSGSVHAPPFEDQVDNLIALGADGVKLIETKPTCRKRIDIPADSDYFEGFFRRVEGTGFPVLWHVADPEEFWDPDLTPAWARSRGWGYDETFVAKETLYSEVERVLARHPRINVIFAHFFFLSADLDRASALFDAYPGVHFDLAPGIELLYNMSRDVPRTREFFETYSSRILYGTDISSGQTPEAAMHRAGIVRRWLESAEEYRVPDGSDFLLGPAEDGLMRGLALSDGALDAIFIGNFARLAGDRPKRLNTALAIDECGRLASEQARLMGCDPNDAPAAAAAAQLKALL